MQTKIFEKYFFFGLLFITFVFTFFIFRPFWIVLVLGASFSIVLYPIYNLFRRTKLPDWISSFVTVLLFVVMFCGPLLLIGVLVFNQSQDVYYNIVTSGHTNIFLSSIEDSINSVLPVGVNFNINSKILELISSISDNMAQIFTTTFSTIFSFLLMLLTIFSFLKDGERWTKSFITLSPLSDANDEKIMNRLSKAVNGVMLGFLLIALLQGFLMGVGLAIFGVPHPALWGVIAAILSLIPVFGTAFVSVPAVVFLFATGHTPQAVGLLIWAVVVVSMVDNFLSPLFVSKKINISPLLVLFSIMGGISLLGPVGMLMGPLSLTLLFTLVSIYRNEFKEIII
ncbi:MAG: AI-2E family transporter [Candidatus Paceibacterota bacterium]|jgi:predicted PurR-regulated permease PerM